MAYNSTYVADKETRVYNFDAGISSAASRRGMSGVSAPASGARIRTDSGARANQGVSAENPRRRRTVSRTPDMSAPRAKAKTPSVAIGLGEVAAAPAAKVKTAAPRVRTISAQRRVPLPVGVVLTSLVCTFLFMVMIYNFVQINESTISVASMRSELSGLMSEEKDLSLRLEKKNDLRAIEEYATSVLGMVKNDQLPKKYVNIDSQDKIEPAAAESTNGNAVSTALDALKERFGEIMEYIN